MTSLKVLLLNDNRLKGTLPAKGLCQLKNLQELDLSYTIFEGTLPSCLGNLTSLQVLDLSHNDFGGNIVSHLISSLTSLEYLSLSYCHFQGSFSFSSLANHSKLEVLESVKVSMLETEDLTWVPAFQLKILHLSSCTFNKPIGAIPSFLHYQYDLRVLDLSHNNFKGKFPTNMLENNTRLEIVNLKNNSFRGPFHLPSSPNVYTSALDVSNNQFDGQVLANISWALPNLMLLNMSTNSFEGIISSIGDMRQLVYLDLSNNDFFGGFSKDLVMRCSSLLILKLSNNSLHSETLPAFSNLTDLRYLQLDRNHFTGTIPHSLSTSSNLEMLDIRNNHISGRLPGWMGNMSFLQTLVMSKNRLEGPIPVEFCTLGSLFYLDLSENYLTDSMPSCFSPPDLTHVYLQKNWLAGPLTHAFSNSFSLKALDISYNNFTGSIPNWIGGLPPLNFLLLKGNNFEGNIPIQLCQLPRISIIDFSHNNLSGPKPSCLNITFQGIELNVVIFVKKNLFHSDLTPSSYSYGNKLIYSLAKLEERPEFTIEIKLDFYDKEKVEFTTKTRSDSYKGVVLELMSGIDLSCNKLTGHIPPEIGTLGDLHALNLSHNYLIGSIPTTFLNLKQIESLDLSYNNLTGTIPYQLTELTSLEVFIVAYNNLSGRMPDIKGQFATFNKSRYEGNPFLCGEQLKKNCSSTIEMPSLTPTAFNKEDKDNGSMDMIAFYMSFAGSYLTALLGFIAVLYINPYWRQIWFHRIHVCIMSSYYFVLDNFPKLSPFFVG